MEKTFCQRCGLKKKVIKVSDKGFAQGHHILACDDCIKELKQDGDNYSRQSSNKG